MPRSTESPRSLPGRPLVGQRLEPPGRPAPAPVRAGPAGSACPSARPSFGLPFVSYFNLFLRKKKSSPDGLLFLAVPLHETFAFFSFGTHLYTL